MEITIYELDLNGSKVWTDSLKRAVELRASLAAQVRYVKVITLDQDGLPQEQSVQNFVLEDDKIVI